MTDEERELVDLWLAGVCKGSAATVAPLLVDEVRRLRDENAQLIASHNAFESHLESLDSAAHDYFKRHGVTFPRGTNFGEAAMEMVPEAERLRAENAALTEKVTTRARRELKQSLSDLSEHCWCAGWLDGWEFMSWHMVLEFEATGKDQFSGQQTIPRWNLTHIRALADDAGGWIVWDDETEETFLPMEEWLPRYAEWAQRWEKAK